MSYNLINLLTGEVISKISKNQLAYLMDNFDIDEWYITDFYINRDDVELLKENEPTNSLIKILYKALGKEEETVLGIEPINEKAKNIEGKIIDKEKKSPIAGLLVKLVNENVLLGDDYIGYSYTKKDGTFKIVIDNIKKLKPENVYLEISKLKNIYDHEWKEIIVKKELKNYNFGEIEISLDEFEKD